MCLKGGLHLGHWLLYFSLAVYVLFFVTATSVRVQQGALGDEEIEIFFYPPKNSTTSYWSGAPGRKPGNACGPSANLFERGNITSGWTPSSGRDGLCFQGNYTCSLLPYDMPVFDAYSCVGKGDIAVIIDYSRWQCVGDDHERRGTPHCSPPNLTILESKGPYFGYSFEYEAFVPSQADLSMLASGASRWLFLSGPKSWTICQRVTTFWRVAKSLFNEVVVWQTAQSYNSQESTIFQFYLPASANAAVLQPGFSTSTSVEQEKDIREIVYLSALMVLVTLELIVHIYKSCRNRRGEHTPPSSRVYTLNDKSAEEEGLLHGQ